MSKEIKVDPKNLTDDQLAQWRKQSRELIETIFLRHPETEAEMVVVSDILDNGDGSFSFIVTEDPASESGFQFLIGMAEVSKGDATPINMSDKPEGRPFVAESVTSDRPTGGLADLLGAVPQSGIITSVNEGGLVGLDGKSLTSE